MIRLWFSCGLCHMRHATNMELGIFSSEDELSENMTMKMEVEVVCCYRHLDPDSSTVIAGPGVTTSHLRALKAFTYRRIGANKSITPLGSSAGAKVRFLSHVWNLQRNHFIQAQPLQTSLACSMQLQIVHQIWGPY